MNSIGKFAALTALVLAAVSCVKENAPDTGMSQREAVVIQGVNPADTRTTLDGLDVLWCEGDVVGIVAVATDYDKVRIDYDYDVKAENIDGVSADFTAFLMGDHKPALMMYPGNEAMVYDHEANTIFTTTPNVFTATLNTFPQGSNLSLGKIEDGQAELKNLMSVFRFEVTGSDVTEINIEARGGEAVAGDVVVDLETMEITSIEGWSSIKMLPAEGQTCITPGVYCIPVPAGHYSQGIAFDFLDTDGFHARKSKTEEFDLPSGKLIDLGRQSDWGIEIHVGLCSTGDLEYLGANRFSLTGSQVKGKDFELENTVFGVEYSLDNGKTWQWIEYGTLSEETVDMEFEVVSPGKMLYRTFAKYSAYDPVRGEEKVYMPGNLIKQFYWDSLDFVGNHLRYVGTDETLRNSFPEMSRRTDKGYSGDDGWDPYQMQMMPGYWADMGFRYPGDYDSGGSSTTWYSFGVQLYMGCKYMDMTVPAVQGCKLDRVMLVTTNSRSLWLLSEPNNTLKLVGDNKSRISSEEITAEMVASYPALADYSEMFMMEWTALSTNPGSSGVATQENTPYYLHTYNNSKILYMELEYIPVE